MKSLLSLILVVSFLGGCTSTGNKDGQYAAGNEISYLAKTDIDIVTDIHIRRANKLLKRLAVKLYRRNPKHCPGGTSGIESCVAQLFAPKQTYPALNGKSRTQSIQLAFDEEYSGDRVMALIIGLKTMISASYGDKKEFFITDELDPQKLYNSARNIEITVWRLSQHRHSNGKLFLLSNSSSSKLKNLSFERLFGQLISLQDTLAEIIAGKTQRTIKNVIQRLATAIFLPI